MKKLLFFFALLQLYVLGATAQTEVFSGRIRLPRKTSFYSRPAYEHDVKIAEKIARRSTASSGEASMADLYIRRSTPTQIAKNVDNPRGTLVVDKDISIDDLKALMAAPEKVVIKEHEISMPFKVGETIYHIPVSNTMHDARLQNAAVLSEIESFANKCLIEEKLIPARIELRKGNSGEMCELIAFRDGGDIIGFKRINGGCVLGEINFANYYCIAE